MPEDGKDGLVSRVLTHAAERPGAVAVSDGHRRIGYAELAERSDRVRRALADAGVRPGTLVALRLRRGVQVPVAILGILRHGCAYLPIDPDYPAARQEFLLADSGAGHLVEADAADELAVHAVPGRRAGRRVPPETAYVIYTSGSTGTPKGVIVGRRHIRALMESAETVFGFGPGDVWSLFHSHSFDFSVWELWGALWSGGRAVVVPAEATWNPAALAELLVRERVSVLNQVPTSFGYLRRALDADPVKLPDLRYVILGGEPVNAADVALWQDSGLAPDARLVNMYGITETTVHVTYQDLDPQAQGTAGPQGTTPIGRPLPHLRVLLVDEHLRPVPSGEPGEIVVLGAAVADGYLGRPELTESRFIRLPGAAGPGYRSGDWAVADEHGALHFIGRRDRQIQVRGFRIEPGEIQAVMTDHPDIEACEVTTAVNALGETVLAAHCLAGRRPHPGPAELRRHAADRLPRHMVPARFVVHDRFPLTANGKVDRNRLDAAAEGTS
jgi:nonribosomal peptide synthetase DhbF